MVRIRKPRPQNFNAPKTCGGKHCYASRQDAQMVIEEKAILQPELELSIYHCVSCGQFHLTRKKPSLL